MRRSSPIVLLMLGGCGPDRVHVGGTDETGQTSTAGSESSGPSTTGDTPEDCGSVSLAPEFVPPEVMLVVDTSRSMAAQTWDHDGDPMTPMVSRWSSARALIDEFAGAMQGRLKLGLQLFPGADACAGTSDCLTPAACSIATTPELPVSEDFLAGLAATLPEPDATTQTLGGGSPAYAALHAAYEQLRMGDDRVPKVVLFIGDGLENCSADVPFPATLSSHDAAVPELVEQAFAIDGIMTAVVGIDPDGGAAQAGLDAIADHDAAAALDELALAGGMPRDGGLNPDGRKFFLPTEAGELGEQCWGVCEGGECIVDLTMTETGPPTPEQFDLITVSTVIDGAPTEQPQLELAACGQADGWAWLVEGVIITMCGAVCDLFRAGGVAFEIRYGCPPAN